MHHEVDMIVNRPFDDSARRFLAAAQVSANRVLRFRGDDRSITITLETHAMDGDGAVKVALWEIAHVYPGGDYQEVGESRSASPPTATDAQ
jgi:hypothetical protein